MAEWIVTPPADPRAFPVVEHAHPNGMLTAIRGRTPETVRELGGLTMARWTYRCPCGATYVLERPR
jgi:hypothetical protein